MYLPPPEHLQLTVEFIKKLMARPNLAAMKAYYQTQKEVSPWLTLKASALLFALDKYKHQDIEAIYQVLEVDMRTIFSFSVKEEKLFWLYLAETNQAMHFLGIFKPHLVKLFSSRACLSQFSDAFRAFNASDYATLYATLEEAFPKEPFGRQAAFLPGIFVDPWLNTKTESEKKLTLCKLMMNKLTAFTMASSELAQLINSLWDADWPTPSNLDEVITELLDNGYKMTLIDAEHLFDFMQDLDSNKLEYVLSKIGQKIALFFPVEALNQFNENFEYITPDNKRILNLTRFKIFCNALDQSLRIHGLNQLIQRLDKESESKIETNSDSYHEIVDLVEELAFFVPIEKTNSAPNVSLTRLKRFFSEMDGKAQDPDKKTKYEASDDPNAIVITLSK
ncbi:MAG: hypothetical protein WC785_02865 [Tatlockia sp.]|jgi:hypothetical protein